MNEIRFTTFIDDCTECEIFALIKDGVPFIQTVNIVGDCVVTYEDLDDEGKAFFLSEAARVMREMQEKGAKSSADEI